MFDGVRLAAPKLEAFARAILAAASMPAERAPRVAQALVAANPPGVDSHGVQLIPLYLPGIRGGFVNLTTDGRVVSETSAAMAYDGEDGIGHWIGRICTEHAIRLAAASGFGMAAVRDWSHIGMCAFWARRMLERGQIGLVFTTDTPLVAAVAGPRAPAVHQPDLCGRPGGERPAWLLDMATTTVAMGKVMRAFHNGEAALPHGWALDRRGRPTTSTAEALQGFLMPLGGYNGDGLGMVVEIVCSVLSGGRMGPETGDPRQGLGPVGYSQCYIAIDVARFLPLDRFQRRTDRLIGMMKSAAPADGYDEVLAAGEPEWRAERIRRREGIPIDEAVWEKLVSEAERLGVPAPWAAGC